MARKRAKPQAAPAVTPAQAEENLRRGNEYYALHVGLSRMFSRERDFAAAILAQIKNTRLPEINKRAVIAETNSLLFYLDALERHVQHGDIAQAVLAAVNVGRAEQMIVRTEQEHLLLQEIGRRTGKRKQEIERKTERENLARKLWAEYDPADVKGRHKEIHKEIGQIMQQRLGLVDKDGKPKPIPAATVRGYLSGKKTGHA